MSAHVLLARLDSVGDVLLTGPAVRAVAAGAARVTLLAGPRGRSAADLLPGVDRVLEWPAPWIEPDPDPVDPEHLRLLVKTVDDVDRALIFTSFHQSPLPLALLLRVAGVPWIGAISDDYPGSLLDLRHRVPDDIPETERALSLTTAAGYPDRGSALAVRRPLPDPGLPPGYLVVHPGTSVPARAWPPGHCAELVELLARHGHPVVVTGSPGERELTARVAGRHGADLGGGTTLAELAGVLAGARVVVAGNTGPAHLAAAVGTPVVSLFAPTVPAVRWAPYGVPHRLLGDQGAACAGTRATVCPVAGHPCLSSVGPAEVYEAMKEIMR
ncbi:glycosyltransferase family 9 protein [Herbidospora yilanensis]|uniref:glycosyltransferase family 9 protein n=1 Tax=Herbidospora yilanensis TaxID=354426 RepID=UPI000781D01B|nr:glycosyltransferase family 9 protein [Herbidospora yilanensis]